VYHSSLGLRVIKIRATDAAIRVAASLTDENYYSNSLILSSYTKVYSVIYDSGSVPE